MTPFFWRVGTFVKNWSLNYFFTYNFKAYEFRNPRAFECLQLLNKNVLKRTLKIQEVLKH